MRRALALAALAALLAACGGDGPVREPVELRSIEKAEVDPDVRWRKSPGSGDGEQESRLQLAIDGELVLTADAEGDVYALDAETGKVRWSVETGARLIAGPSVVGDLVLFGTLDAETIALKRGDGSPAWKARLSSEVLAPPVGEGGVVIVRCVDGKIFGLSAETGIRRWSFDRAVPPLTLRGLSTPLLHRGTAIVGLDNGRVAALNIDTGDVLWEEVVSAPEGRSELERIVDVDAELLPTAAGLFALSFGGDLAAISVEEGRVAWRRPVKSYTGAALYSDKLFVSDEAGVLWGLDGDTGAAAWKQEALQYRGLSAPVVVGDHVVVGDFEGYLHWLSPADGRIIGRVRAVSGPVATAPLLYRDRLYVLDREGGIAVVEAKALN
jgi:outer membrane protein assembly factor BamB